eukprot:jgi/Bigna1/142527/aug1.70_g17235
MCCELTVLMQNDGDKLIDVCHETQANSEQVTAMNTEPSGKEDGQAKEKNAGEGGEEKKKKSTSVSKIAKEAMTAFEDAKKSFLDQIYEVVSKCVLSIRYRYLSPTMFRKIWPPCPRAITK